MKDTPIALRNVYASEVVTLASLWRIRRQDGVELGFTDCDQDVVYGGLTYHAATGFTRTALESQAGLSVDNVDVQGLIDSEMISAEDIIAGKYRGAEVWYSEIDYTNPSAGQHKMAYGIIGRITMQQDYFQSEMRGLTGLLDQEVGDQYGRYCRHVLGDSKIVRGVEVSCGIVLEPPVWTPFTVTPLLAAVRSATPDGRRYVCTTAGTTSAGEPVWNPTVGGTTQDGSAVWTTYPAYTYYGETTSVISRQKFADTARTEGADVFRSGIIEFTTGRNAGLRMDIKSNTGTGDFVLMFPLPFAIEVGDQYKVSVGCNKLLRMPDDVWGEAYTGDCRAKFSPETNGNARRFGGEPEIPGNDAAVNIL